MTNDNPLALRNRLDALAQKLPGDDAVFWFARDLLDPIGYARPENFMITVRRAIAACKTAGQDSATHFRGVSRTISVGRVRDVRLTRYACRLLAMNGDARQASIAFAREYFGESTRRSEPSEAAVCEKERAKVADTPVKVESTTTTASSPKPATEGSHWGRSKPVMNGGSRFIPQSGGGHGKWNQSHNSRWNQNLAVGRGHPNQGARNSK